MKNITFMVLGDAHLDSEFQSDISKRRGEQRAAFSEAMALCREYAFDYVFVPGDLFDKRIPGKETVEFVKNSFAALKKTTFIIAPGNHDPFTVDSPYYNEIWPDNVKIFGSSELYYFEFEGADSVRITNGIYNDGAETEVKRGVRVYGAAFDGHFARQSLLTGESGKVPRLSGGFVNILVMHGTFSEGKKNYNKLDEGFLRSIGFDACIVGGTHKPRKNDTILSSGILCPRGFSETGDTGVLVGEINAEGRVLSEFLPINKQYYDVIKFDVTDEPDFSARVLSEKIKALGKEGTCIKVKLCGSTQYGEEIDSVALKEALLGYFAIAEVEDITEKAENIIALSRENSPRGIFARILLEKTTDSEEFTVSDVSKAAFSALREFGAGGEEK